MTVGWILESAREAFLAGTDPVPAPRPPLSPTYACPFCDRILSTPKQQQDHVSRDHMVERPILLISGAEPAKKSVLRSQLASNEVCIANATNQEIRINGGSYAPISNTDFARVFAEQKQSEVSLRITNASQPRATPVHAQYDVNFRIVDAATLRKVEEVFSEVIMSGKMTRALVTKFDHDERLQGAAHDYATGIADYTMGVLLKERPEYERLTMPFSSYRDSYGKALEVLAYIDRPFARLVSDIIRFALNDFSRAHIPTGYWELDLANGLLKEPDRKKLPSAPSLKTPRYQICPVDHATSKILDLAYSMSKQKRWSPILGDDCRQTANSPFLDATDKQKALAIWAITCWRLGAKKDAIEPLRQIAATYPFNEWAEPYLEMVTK